MREGQFSHSRSGVLLPEAKGRYGVCEGSMCPSHTLHRQAPLRLWLLSSCTEINDSAVVATVLRWSTKDVALLSTYVVTVKWLFIVTL